MTSQDHKMGVEALDAEKQNAAHEEYSAEVLDKKGNGDYSGAVAKSDPEEIKLVKKLDKWIMVRLPISIENIFQPTHIIAHPLVDVLAQLPRPQRHHPRPSERLRGRSQPPRLTV